MRRRFFIVFNPSAGVPRRRFFSDVITGLAARGALATVLEQADPKAAAAAAREALSSHDVIVAAGGDGTVRQVAAAIGEAEIPLGLIPLGTGNVLAREIGLRRRAPEVVATLLEGRVATVHGARANGTPFYLMAGVGFDGRIVAALDQGLKRRLGRAAYADAVTRTLALPMDQLEVTVDGARREANWLIAANASHYGGGFILRPGASIFEAGLEVVLIRAGTRLKLLKQLTRLARGVFATGANPNVTVIAAREVMVTAQTSVPVQLDGDRFGTTPLVIDANGPQLRLIVPG